MGRNIALRIKVEFVETEAEPSSDRCPQEQADGAFSFVLPEADELNISALDRATLDVSFPALREAVSRHLAQAGFRRRRSLLSRGRPPVRSTKIRPTARMWRLTTWR
jgi:hypothetical protein